jgi:hypothetical protein
MNRWRVGEDRGSKETDGCPLTAWKTVKETRKIAAVNEKTKWESLYQNRRNIRQTDGRMVLYNL